MAEESSHEERLIRPPDMIYRRITPGNWSLHKGQFVVRPSDKQFAPHYQDGLVSVGVHSLIEREEWTPEDAMLWGEWRHHGLVRLDLQVIYDAGLTLHHDPKPLPPDGEGPWHANIHGVPLADSKENKKRRSDLQRLFRDSAVWVKPPHADLIDAGFEEWLGELAELQTKVPAASAINEWRVFADAVNRVKPSRVADFIQGAEQAIDELKS